MILYFFEKYDIFDSNARDRKQIAYNDVNPGLKIISFNLWNWPKTPYYSNNRIP